MGLILAFKKESVGSLLPRIHCINNGHLEPKTRMNFEFFGILKRAGDNQNQNVGRRGIVAIITENNLQP